MAKTNERSFKANGCFKGVGYNFGNILSQCFRIVFCLPI